MRDDLDVLIVGAGLSGIGAAVHLLQNCPAERFLILEGRDRIGGTWDLFRYPGVRSDSDMFTLGYRFKPWTAAKAIADGPSIRAYIEETAREHGLARFIRFAHRARHASFDSTTARWTVTVDTPEGEVRLRTRFLYMCAGYYSYRQGHRPSWPGEAEFGGPIIHPQFWPESLDYAGRRIIVIGSGATAVTLVPELARHAAHVTMLQRSPTWMVSRPSRDIIADGLRWLLPARTAYAITRWKNVTLGQWFYRQTRKNPKKVNRTMLERVRKQLPQGFDLRHFTPRYNVWDQRLCLVPDADLFKAIRAGTASVVTGEIERFTATGIALRSGEHIEADIIVTATGLRLEALGGISLSVDGRPVRIADTLSYKGMMFSGVPNLAASFGYINASWTLRSDLIAGYVCRLLNHMRACGLDIATPTPGADVRAERLAMDLSSGYVQRGADAMPRSGSRPPWQVTASYTHDRAELEHGRLDDDMVFSRARALAEAAE